ncbi:hypothetical protein PJI16_15540 [Nitrospira sp. MA-1]|nr:hypothetical protein [Nitrospira sp. MA-1]
MDLTGKTLWQVGAGDTDRSYGDICIKYDVMLAGPGELGEYEKACYAHLGHIRRFCREALSGDIVLLRLGTGDILAVGEIVDDKAEWLKAFADVDGWDLQHVRRVRWFPNTKRVFPPRTLGGQVRTFAAVNVEAVRTWVESLAIAEHDRNRALAHVPAAGTELDPVELARRLFIEGLPSEHVDKLLATFSSLQRVASWYWNETKRPEGRPSEQETVCYLVVPFLLSLGWSQQTAAVQWNYVDVALFNGMPSTESTLTCVVEAKLLGKSVFSPLGQALEYALRPGRERCNRLIVTDGIRYALHRREGDKFALKAYLNILNVRDGYPVLGCGGAVDAVLGMAR